MTQDTSKKSPGQCRKHAALVARCDWQWEVNMAAKNEGYREHWSREGFYGDGFNVIRPQHVPDYLSVNGPHAPHRLRIGEVTLPDNGDPEALPVPILVGRSGVRL